MKSSSQLIGMPLDEMERLVADAGFESFRARQLFRQVHLRGVDDPSEMKDIPKKLRQFLADRVEGGSLPVERLETASDGTRKMLFRLKDNEAIEGVLIGSRNPAKVTQCVSTQVGCAMRCAFCRTGELGLKRNLTPGEIVGQILAARSCLAPNERVSNLVFMGMGSLLPTSMPWWRV